MKSLQNCWGSLTRLAQDKQKGKRLVATLHHRVFWFMIDIIPYRSPISGHIHHENVAGMKVTVEYYFEHTIRKLIVML